MSAAPDYVSLDEAKAFLRITGTAEDASLALVVSAASQACTDLMSGDPRAASYQAAVNGTGGPAIALNRSPIIAVSALSVGGVPVDLARLAWDDVLVFRTDGGRFPRGLRNVAVSFTAGLSPLPAAVRQAVLYTVQAMRDAADVDHNSLGESINGVLSSQWQQMGPGTVPPSARTLLAPYTNRFFAP